MASEGNFLQRLVHLKLLEPTTDVKIDLQQFEKQSFLAVMSFSNMRGPCGALFTDVDRPLSANLFSPTTTSTS